MADENFDDLDAMGDGDDDMDLDSDLDDMLGDEDMGGDEGGGGDEASGDDSELDSFFEDLSSIEDLDESKEDGGGDEAVAEEKESAKEPASEKKAEKKAAPAGAKSGKGKKFLVYTLILAILGGGGYAGYWWFSQPEGETLPEDLKEPLATLQDETVEEVIRVEPKQPVKPIKRKPVPVPKPRKPKIILPSTNGRYLVQVAICSFDECKQTYITKLRKKGFPVQNYNIGDKYDFIEVVSKQVYNRTEAEKHILKVNLNNKLPGYASLKEEANGYRVTMGTIPSLGNAGVKRETTGYRVTMGSFPALDKAKEVKYYLEKFFPDGELIFNLEHRQQSYGMTKICSGPYATRSEANSILAQLKRDRTFRGSFVTTR